MKPKSALHRFGRLVFVLGLALTSCVVNPVTGEREISVMSPQREATLGAQAAEQVEREIGLVRDPALESYVQTLAQRLARRSPRQDVPYNFFIANMEEPNAFALPGGYIYVSRGLLVLCNSEAELAGVIGHEIGHVAARHAAQRETRSLGVGILSALGTIAAGALGGAEAAQSVAQLGQVAGAGLIASYGRDQERQADELGQRMAAESGWNPAGISDFLTTLGRETQLRTGQQRRPSFLDSHPSTAERVQTTAARAASLQRAPLPPVAASREGFFAKLRGLVVGPDPAGGVFVEDNVFLHPDLDFSLRFPAGWATQNGQSAVAAGAPSQDAMIRLEVQGPPADPRSAAQQFLSQNQLQAIDTRSLRIGGLAAFRAVTKAQTQQGELGIDLTWIAHPKATFRITGMAPTARFSTHAGAFQATATSFGALSASERARIVERNLEIATARRGETLAALTRRTGNAWSVDETAVSNGLDPSVRLAGGEAIKIAIERPYRP